MTYFSKTATNLDMMQTMFRQSGAIQDTKDGDLQAPTLRQAIQRCASCSETEACRNWLTLGEEGNLTNRTPPNFCPNSSLQKMLKITR